MAADDDSAADERLLHVFHVVLVHEANAREVLTAEVEEEHLRLRLGAPLLTVGRGLHESIPAVRGPLVRREADCGIPSQRARRQPGTAARGAIDTDAQQRAAQ